jgi:hypothetical protein
VSPEQKHDWPALKRCLARLHREARPFLGRALLIGGGACLFYRARLAAAGDPDFTVPTLAPEAEQLWLSKDLDFTGVFSGDALELIPQFVTRDSAGREFLEVEGVRLGFAQVGLTIDPERALETARTGEFEADGALVHFLVADPVTLYREKQALVLRRNQPGDALHLALLHDYLAWEITVAAGELLTESTLLPVPEARLHTTLLTDASHRVPEILRDARIQSRLGQHLVATNEIAATVRGIFEAAA